MRVYSPIPSFRPSLFLGSISKGDVGKGGIIFRVFERLGFVSSRVYFVGVDFLIKTEDSISPILIIVGALLLGPKGTAVSSKINFLGKGVLKVKMQGP